MITAFLKSERADFSACTTWGVFYKESEEDGQYAPNVILLDAHKERLEFPELKKLAMEKYNAYKPDAFIVEAPDLHKSSKFYGKVAIMRLPENAKVKLSISRAFPDFVYDGIPEQVQPEMVLVADCSVSPRLKSIFEEMRNRFGN